MRIALCLAPALVVVGFVSPSAAISTLVANYQFDGNTNDSSGDNYNGTVNGTAAYAPGVGGSGQAFSFDGNTNIATTTTDNLGLVGQSFTVDAWVNFANPTGGDLSVFGTTTGSPDKGLHFLERGDKPFMGFYADDLAGNTPLAANTWYNLAFVYDAVANTKTIYVSTLSGNTVTTYQDATGPSGSSFQGTGETALIGAACCGGQMNGLIDNLKVYDSALNIDQVHAAAAVPEPATLALFGLGAVGLLIAGRRRK